MRQFPGIQWISDRVKCSETDPEDEAVTTPYFPWGLSLSYEEFHIRHSLYSIEVSDAGDSDLVVGAVVPAGGALGGQADRRQGRRRPQAGLILEFMHATED